MKNTNSSRKNQGLTYCRPEKRNELHEQGNLGRTTSCSICNFHIREKNHAKGSHHYNSPGAITARKN